MAARAAAAASASGTRLAQRTFELENKVDVLDDREESILRSGLDDHKREIEGRPWKNDPNYFKKVRISASALVKMVMHARRGGAIEVMGLMQGKVRGDTMYVVDAFALPVEGTETRVNAADEANEYMVNFMSEGNKAGRWENAIGWYHSHPGYGCWLSGIDVGTQMTNQMFMEPWVAIVIDPNRTISAGKVDIGAFRTYPENYKPPESSSSEYQNIPLSKIEDFGVHSSRYYSLEVSHYKSQLDGKLLEALWNKYWVSTLSQSPLLANRSFVTGAVSDLVQKLSNASRSMSSQTEQTARFNLMNDGEKKDDKESALSKVVQESHKLSSEAMHGLINQVFKNILYKRSRAMDDRGEHANNVLSLV